MSKMAERIQFIKLINPIQRQQFFELVVKEAQLLLVMTGIASCFLLLFARFLIIPFLSNYFIGMLVVLLLFFSIRLWIKRPRFLTAVKVYNEYVPDDRVITAYSFLENKEAMATLQLADAIKHMKLHHETVTKRKRKWMHPKLI